MKKLVVLFLAFVILFNTAGYFFIHTAEFIKHKRSIKQMAHEQILKEHKTTTFYFTKAEFAKLKWKEKHEFYLNSNLYDVVKLTETERGVTITCINDKLEKQLIAMLDNNASGNKKSEKESISIETTYYQNICINVPSPFIIENKNIFSYVFSTYDSPLSAIKQPPKLS